MIAGFLQQRNPFASTLLSSEDESMMPPVVGSARSIAFVLLLVLVAVTAGWEMASSRFGKPSDELRPQALPMPSSSNSGTKPPPAKLPPKSLPDAKQPQDETDARLAEEKTQILRNLITGIVDYQRRWDQLCNERPPLREIPDLIKWLGRMPQRNFPEAVQEFGNMVKSSPEKDIQIYNLWHYDFPDVMQNLLQDSTYGLWMKEIIESPESRKKIEGEFAVMDSITGFKNPPPEPPTSPLEDFADLVEQRVAVYHRVGAAKESEWGFNLTDSQREYLFAEAQRYMMTEIFKVYYDQLFTGEIVEMANDLKKQEAAYYSFPKSIAVPKELWERFKAVREPLRLTRMGK